MFPVVVENTLPNGDLQVLCRTNTNDLYYVRDNVGDNAIPVLEDWIKTTYKLPLHRDLKDIIQQNPLFGNLGNPVNNLNIYDSKKYAKKLGAGKNPVNLTGYRMARYHEGLDGEKTFAEASGASKSYKWILVKIPNAAVKLTIPKELVQEFFATLNIIRDDKHGHLVQHPHREGILDKVKKNVEIFLKRGLKPGDFLFLEKDTKGNPISIGHHYRFRRKYRDSIHVSKPYSYAFNCKDNLRKILIPLPTEDENDGLSPQELSGARGFFGYCSQNEYNPSAPTSFGIGKEDFAQLAGRISCNFAVEDLSSNAGSRFVAGVQNFVPLRPLGGPKPSAVEHYLTQAKDHLSKRNDGGTLCTYGDSLDDPSAGQLRGRKFYLHQPDAIKNENCYNLSVKPHRPDEIAQLPGNLAVFCRFISLPKTKFKFMVKFRDLRKWEIGALLFALSPDEQKIKQIFRGMNLPFNQLGRIKEWFFLTQWWNNDPKPEKYPLLSHKIGHGRPLGLGSVKITPKLKRLTFGKDLLPVLSPLIDGCDELYQAFGKRISDCLRDGKDGKKEWVDMVLYPWLQVHRYAGRKHFDYPRGNQGNIFSYHSQLRKNHSDARKMAKPFTQVGQVGLKELDELDKEGL